MTTAYLDTSALVRLLHTESHSKDLENYLRDNRVVLCTSDLSRTEVIKALGLTHYNEKLWRSFSQTSRFIP
jgi:predicted nucleic acid-binding protein